MNNLRILLTGKLCGDQFEWHIAPPLPQTDEPTKLVSRYMNRHGFLDMQANYHLDGWYAATEGQPLAAMPTEYHEVGWYASYFSKSKQERLFDGSVEEDHDWIRGGC